MNIEETTEAWATLQHVLAYPNSEEEYEEKLLFWDSLKDNSELSSLASTLRLVLDRWQSQNIPKTSPRDILEYLMKEHGLRQVDLPEVGHQGIISEILSGKRKLNLRQMKAISRRFGFDIGIFI